MKFSRLALLILSVALACICLFGCSGEHSKRNIALGQVIEWTFEYEGDVADLTVSASDSSVCSVDYIQPKDVNSENGVTVLLRGVGKGFSTVSAVSETDSKFEATIDVTVEKEKNVYIGKGNLCQDITLSNQATELYKDDVTVTYTVKTALSVDKIVLSQLESSKRPTYFFKDIIDFIDTDGDIITLNSLTVDKESLSSELITNDKRQAYSATRTEEKSCAVWVIKWNLGNTAVKFVQLNFIDTDADKSQLAYAKADVHYPLVDASKGLDSLISKWVFYNLDEPLFFEINTNTLSDEQKKLYFELDTPEAIFGTSTVSVLDGTSEENLSLPHIKNQVLASYPKDRVTFMLYPEMSDEERATIAYKNGYSIDKSTFPYAHNILNQVELIIPSIATETMSVFEIERMIYSWMIKSYLREEGLSSFYPIGAEHQCQNTAYGFINGYECSHLAWSSTFKMICDMVNIPCSVVNVEKAAGGEKDSINADYTVNVVKIEDEYYIVDSYSFWQKDEPTDGDYRFFNMTSEKASEFYSWTSDGDINPSDCNYTTYLVNDKTGELLSDMNK